MKMKFFGNKFKMKNIGSNKETISFLTDVEGNLDYMQRWADRSKHIQFTNNSLSFRNHNKLQSFVYAGDFPDKGPGDLRVGNALTKFKMLNPHNVCLIAGNREIKCRRFTYELDQTKIRQRLLHGQAAFWNKQSSPKNYVVQQMLQDNITSTSDADIEKYISKLSKEQCQTLYLKWMLNNTMGCGPYKNKPSTFEYRRIELAEIFGKPIEQISDEEVTQSFIDSVAPNGVITNYLKQAQLGLIKGETLFLHGAVTPENMGYVPGLSEKGLRISDAKEWVDMLNNWYQEQINEWDNQRFETELLAPGHKPLDSYVLFNPKSVVTTNWYQQGKLGPISPEVINFLNQAGIYRVVTGHQPFSDLTLIIREPRLEIIVGDTGYSDPEAIFDNRGKAIHNLEIVGSGTDARVNISAIRKNNSVIDIVLPSHAEVLNNKDSMIGHFTENQRLIRPGYDGKLVSSQLEGFDVLDEAMPEKKYRFDFRK